MNERDIYGNFRARAFRLPAWQMVLFGAVAAALVITLAVFATAVFLLVFPIMIGLDWLYRWRSGRTRKATQARTHQGTVITADYEVLPPERAEERRSSQ